MAKKKYDWYKIYKSFNESNLSGIQFCRKYNIPDSSFYTQINKYREKFEEMYKQETGASTFVKVNVENDVLPLPESDRENNSFLEIKKRSLKRIFRLCNGGWI